MKRLDTKTLPAFLADTRTAVLFVSNDSNAAMDHAENFALLWAQAVVAGLTSVRFAYIDGDTNPEICKRFGVTELPSTLVIQKGAVIRRSESPVVLSLHALVSTSPAAGRRTVKLPALIAA